MNEPSAWRALRNWWRVCRKKGHDWVPWRMRRYRLNDRMIHTMWSRDCTRCWAYQRTGHVFQRAEDE